MKVILKVLVMCVIITSLFLAGRAVSNAQDVERYVVVQESDGYSLYLNGNDSDEAVRHSESLMDIVDSLSKLSGETELNFYNLRTDENLTFKQNDITLRGNLTFFNTAGIVVDGANLSIKDMNIEFDLGNIRVKRGSLTFVSGALSSEAENTILLDYASSASYIQKGGSIASSASGATILLKQGTVEIEGGEIINPYGLAISSHSTLILSGSPRISGARYDVYTNTPITLSSGGNSFSGEAKIKYDADFLKGSIACVAYNANEQSLSELSFYDKNDNPVKVEYFSEHERVDECDFAAVWLPYIVKFYDNGSVIETAFMLDGETVNKIFPPGCKGYSFVGWKNKKDGELFEFSVPISEDAELYAEYKLQAPTYSMSSLSFVYDQKEHLLRIDELSHPLLSEAIVSYSWYKNGKNIYKYSDSVVVKNVSDSGEYYCVINFAVRGESISINSCIATVDIEKQNVEAPIIPPSYYSGEIIYPQIYSSALYSVEKKGGVLVGAYPIKITLNDEENYQFADTDSAELFVDFTILKAENQWIEELKIEKTYTGMAPEPCSMSRFGDVIYLYSEQPNADFDTQIPSAAGIYYVKAVVYETENFTAIESESVQFYVIEEVVEGLSILTAPNKSEFVAFEKFSTDGISIGVSFNSGRYEEISGNELSVEYINGDCFRFGDTFVILTYEEKRISVMVRVRKAQYDISGITFEDSVEVFDSQRKSSVLLGELPIGEDGIRLGYYIEGGGVNVGEYGLTLHFTTSSNDYEPPSSISAKLQILPFETSVIWENDNFVYDGNLKIPAAHYIDVHGRKILLSVTGAHSYAGEYTAVAICEDKNYSLSSMEKSYTINKADYDFSRVEWTSTEFFYDGEEKRVELTNLPSGVYVVGYLNNRATDSGEYKAVAKLSYDENNYNEPDDLIYVWRIEKGTYDTSGFSFSDVSVVFDGIEHFPIFDGEMPIGKDGIRLEYSFGRGAIHVLSGGTDVEIVFSTKSDNYRPPETITRKVNIIPKEINVIWEKLEFVYSASSHIPSASSDECEVVVSGAGKNAGKYIAICKPLSADYTIINNSVEFIIEKAENEWTKPPVVNDLFCGEDIEVLASTLGGNVEFAVYSDINCSIEIEDPKSAGVYYLKVFCNGNENYNSIVSEPIRFEIIEVVLESILVVLNKESYFAFENIMPQDLTVKVIYNNGAEETVEFEKLNIEYQNADSFRVKDEYVVISYKSLKTKVAIQVFKCDYDICEIEWRGLNQVYDGTEKTVSIVGLPEGITVLCYLGLDGAINAGEYVVDAVVSFDSENYNEPDIPSAIMCIERQTVEILEPCIMQYCATILTPTFLESSVYEIEFVAAKDVGTYNVTIMLNDCENYVFENGKSQAETKFIITPMVLCIKISDVDLYRDQSVLYPEYVITDGELLGEDVINCSYVYDQDHISAVFDNDNYYVIVSPGKINRIESLSPDGLNRLLIIIFVVVAGLLGVITIILSRKKLYRYYRGVLCRLAFDGEGTCTTSENDVQIVEKDENSSADEDDFSGESISNRTESEVDDYICQPGVFDDKNVLPSIIDIDYADSAISDSLARDLIRHEDYIVTSGRKKGIVNVDTLSRSFDAGDRVDINILKEKSLIPYDTAYIKVLARGMIDKPLTVYANDFSLSAVKMIALCGGKSIRVATSVDSYKKK